MKLSARQGIFFAMNRKYRFFLILIILYIPSSEVFSENIFGREADYNKQAFEMSFAVDLPTAAAGGALVLTGFFMEGADGLQTPENEIFQPDRSAMFEYSASMDSICDILFYSSLLLPASTLISADLEGALEVGVMFFEAMALTWGTKDIIKNSVVRYRPYTYFSAPVDDDYMDSFPSGHTAASFAVSSFTSYVFSEMYPDSKAKIPVVAGSFTISTAMAVLRVLSGNHYITDVLSGAAIGALFGVGVPLLHKLNSSNDSVIVGIFPADENGISLAFEI